MNKSLLKENNLENLKKHWNHKRVNKPERAKYQNNNPMSKIINQKKFKKAALKT